jgi:hypothetical protein
MHFPFIHTKVHTSPQAPQFWGSVLMSTQTPEQEVIPLGHPGDAELMGEQTGAYAIGGGSHAPLTQRAGGRQKGPFVGSHWLAKLNPSAAARPQVPPVAPASARVQQEPDAEQKPLHEAPGAPAVYCWQSPAVEQKTPWNSSQSCTVHGEFTGSGG